MFNKLIKYIVYLLSLLIIVALIAVIYGIYIKISHKASKNFNKVTSLSLIIDQEIKNIQVIDNNRILITISNDDKIQGIIFDINKQEIVQRIKK